MKFQGLIKYSYEGSVHTFVNNATRDVLTYPPGVPEIALCT